jgi:hypothetical protein
MLSFADASNRKGWCQRLVGRGWESQRAGLGEEFLAALARAEDTVRTNPVAFRVVRRDARRVMLRRFPYQLIYRVVSEVVVVVACFHGRRSPKRWESRTGE